MISVTMLFWLFSILFRFNDDEADVVVVERMDMVMVGQSQQPPWFISVAQPGP